MRIFLITIFIIVSVNAFSESEVTFLVPSKCKLYTEDYFSKHKERNKFSYSFSELEVHIDAYRNIAGVGKIVSKTLDQGQLFHLATGVMMECYPLTSLETNLDDVAVGALLYRIHKSGKDIHGITVKDDLVTIYVDNILKSGSSDGSAQ